MYFFGRLLLYLVFGLVLFAAGCSKEDVPGKSEDGAGLRISGGDSVVPVERPEEPYKGWVTQTYHNIRVHYPPDHPRADLVADMVKVYEALIRRDAQFFRMQAPRDTLEIYFYTGVGHGNAVTGTIYPHVDSGVIHQWLPSNYGPMAAEYMLERWEPGEPRHAFLKNGVTKLLDFTGNNYHELTRDLIEGDKFVPLRELAADTSFAAGVDPSRAGEAASFVDFVVFTYGIEPLRTMYTSVEPFDVLVEGMFQMPVESLEVRWLDLARQAVQPEAVLDSLTMPDSGESGK